MKKYLKLICVLVFGGLVLAGQAFALVDLSEQAALEPSFSAVVVSEPKTASLGRAFDLNIELSAPATLQPEEKGDISKDFAITAVKQDSKNPLLLTLTIIPFNLGKINFEGITFVDENGATAQISPFEIEVKPTKTKIKTQGLVDIKGPYKPYNPWLIFYIAILLAAGYFAYKYHKKYQAKKAFNGQFTPLIKDDRPLDIAALDKIDKLTKSGLWEKGEYKNFYIKMVDIFRDYISLRFNFDARQYTSRELMRRLKNTPDFKANLTQTASFQGAADYVKFAKATPTLEERDKEIKTLKTIIAATKKEEIISTTPEVKKPEVKKPNEGQKL
ncbi:MAG: hypothetical protein LBM71_00075 [Elusimicrobiota bacterium]|jgi:hypothetical protein|nr:hypothetical protein [Elusimicrobiota bacterium]